MHTKHRGSILIIATICALLLIMLGCGNPAASAEPKPKAVSGTIDFTAYDFEKDGTISLDGEWEFY